MPGYIILAALAVPLPPTDDSLRDALTRYALGRLRVADERPAAAAKQFEAAVKLDPESPEPLRPLVQVYIDLGRDAAAIRTAKKILELDPADADTAHTLGKLLFESKNFPDAARVLKQAASSPQLTDRPVKRLAVLRDLARVCTAADDAAGAEEALKQAANLIAANRAKLLQSSVFSTPADLDRESATIQEKLGQALTTRKKWAEAGSAFAEASKTFATLNDTAAAARLNWNLSGVLAEAGDPNAALERLQKYLDLGPSNPEAYRRLAELLRKLGRREEAIKDALTGYARRYPKIKAISWVIAVETGRNDLAAAQRLLMNHALTTSDPVFYQLATQYYREASRPADVLAMADLLYRTARGPNANNPQRKSEEPVDPAAGERARAFTAAVRADRQLSRLVLRYAAETSKNLNYAADTWELIAGIAERDGRLDLAELALRKVNRSNREAAFRLLEVLAKQRKWADLKAETEQHVITRQQNLDPMYFIFLARARAELDDDAGALAVVDQLARLGGTRSKLEKPRVQVILGRYRDAVRGCEDLLAETANASEARQIRLVLADALNGLKDYPRAEAELRTVLEEDPDDMLVLNNLGYNLADQGRKLDEAEAMIRRAIELDRDERRRTGAPDDEQGVYLDSLGWVLFRRGKLAEAREVLEKAAEMPDAATDAVVWDHLGDVAFRQGDKARAKTVWVMAKKLYTGSHQGRQQDRIKELTRKLALVL